jgi:hypothetical protein
MIEFKSLKEAIAYHTNCVVCQAKLSMNDRDLADRFSTNDDELIFYISPNLRDTITISKETDQITHIYEGWLGSRFIHGLSFHCEECCQFAYNFQIHMDLGLKKITGIFLNSESISIEDGKDLHEIKNIYSTKKTEYSYFPNELGDPMQTSGYKGSIEFPLIPLNLIKPMETVARIRKLIIYT